MDDPATGDPVPEGGRSRAWIMLVLVLGVAGVALLVMDRRGPTTPPMSAALDLSGEPDFNMDGAAVSQYRDDGTLEYRLLATSIRYYEAQARTELDRPRLSLHDPERQPWHVSAERGELRRPPYGASEEQVSLRGDVTLEQTPEGHGPVRLRTPELRLFPRRQYAETDQDVMIEGDIGRTTATGLQGDLQLGILNIFSADGGRVSTVLQPEQFK